MEIKTVIDPLMGENTYVLINEDNCLLIDPGSEDETVLRKIHELISGKHLRAVIYTHCHFDHIGGGRHFNCDQYMSKEDIEEMPVQTSRARSFYGVEVTPPENLKLLTENMRFPGFEFKVISTPGHTKGGVCFFFENKKVLFTGDTLFKGTYGRTDIGGNVEEMRYSLKMLSEMDGELEIYPGHGDSSTIGSEKE